MKDHNIGCLRVLTGRPASVRGLLGREEKLR